MPHCDYATARCISAWDDLCTCRGVGMTAGPIPWTAIDQWCRSNGLDEDSSRIVTYVIRTLDIDRAEAEQTKRALDEQQRARNAARR